MKNISHKELEKILKSESNVLALLMDSDEESDKMKSVISKIDERYGNLTTVVVDVDTFPSVAEVHDAFHFPTTLLFADGFCLDQHTGLKTLKTIEDMVRVYVDNHGKY